MLLPMAASSFCLCSPWAPARDLPITSLTTDMPPPATLVSMQLLSPFDGSQGLPWASRCW